MRHKAEKNNTNSSKLIISNQTRNIPINSEGFESQCPWCSSRWPFTFHFSPQDYPHALWEHHCYVQLRVTGETLPHQHASLLITEDGLEEPNEVCPETMDWVSAKGKHRWNKPVLLRTSHWKVLWGTKHCSSMGCCWQNLLLEPLFFRMSDWNPSECP